MNRSILFSGNASETLGKRVLGLSPWLIDGKPHHVRFPSGELYCQLKENVRGADVFLLNAISSPANDNLMQLLIMADAARRSSAGRITAVIPYMGYSRQDRKDKSRVPISVKLLLDIIEAAGINRVVAMDLHAAQIQGMTNIPFDHLQFRPALLEQMKQDKLAVDIVVAPDVGAIKRAEEYAERMDVELGVMSKKRKSTTTVKAMHFIGDVDKKNVLIVDDLTESAGTLIEAASQCKTRGAAYVACAITHGCFTEVGYNRLKEAFANGCIDRLYVSDTVKSTETFPKEWVTVVDIAPVLAKAIWSIHNNESVSSLFV